MYILLNALKNLVRNKGRNILVGFVLLAIIATTVVALVINSTTSVIIDEYRTRFGSRVNISLDMEAYLAEAGVITAGMALPGVTAEQAIAFAQSEYLMGHIMSATKITGNNELRAVGESDVPFGMVGSGLAFEGDEYMFPKFSIMGNVWDDFETGGRVLLGGRMPGAYGEVLVSQEMAALNNLAPGDAITVFRSESTPDGGIMHIRNVPYVYTIVGTYVCFADIAANPFGFASGPLMNRNNEVLAELGTLMNEVAGGGVVINATFYLRDPAYLPHFEAEIRGKGLSEMMVVSTDEASFNAIVKPVEGLRSVSITFMVVVLALGAIILVLLSGMAIRERRYEIGVLRAMGMKKARVAKGLLYEMGALTSDCQVLGLISGTVAAQPIADALLLQQVEAVGDAQNGFQQRGMAGNLPVFDISSLNAPEPLSEIDVRLGLDAMAQIAAISILLALIASLMGIINVTKHEPIKILMERD